MTLRDMTNAGVQFQGMEIIIKAWNDETETYSVLHTAKDELLPTASIALDLEVSYIYCNAHNQLVVEVKMEDE